MNREKLHYLETFEGWLLIIFSDSGSYTFQAFSPVGKKWALAAALILLPQRCNKVENLLPEQSYKKYRSKGITSIRDRFDFQKLSLL